MTKVITVTSKGEKYDVLVDKDLVLPTDKIFKGAGKYFWFRVNGKNTYLHRWVMGLTDGSLVVDHVNHDFLDNRKDNLRVCTKLQNQQNSRRKGYSYHKGMKKWRARMTMNRKEVMIGYYDTPEEAREAYKEAHAKAYGEFSPYHKEMI